MLQQQSKIIKTYCSEIRKLLPIYGSREKRFLFDIKNTIIEYTENNNQVTQLELIKNIGEPKDLVSKYLLDIDGEILRKAMSKTRCIRVVSIILVTIAILSAFFKFGFEYRSFIEGQTNYIEREIITID